MNLRERVNAILHGRPYTRGVPVISFGYWVETLDLWAQQGHVTQEEVQGYRQHGDNSQADRSVMNKLGFDFNWNRCVGGRSYLYPSFQPETLRTEPDGARIIRNNEGLIVRVHDGTSSRRDFWHLHDGARSMGGDVPAAPDLQGSRGS